MNKKAIAMAVALVASLGVFAAPHGGPRGGHGGHGHHGGRGPAPVMHHHGGHHHGGTWGHGGRNFWPGFVGGVVGGMVYDAITPSPKVVVTTPVVTTPVVTTPVVTTPVVTAPVATVQNVWVEGRYVDQVQPNGVVIRVWQPGHYEQRTVYVQ